VLGNPSTYVFKNVTAITLSNDTPLENATVLVRGEEITDVTTDETEPPEGAIVIDGTGKYLIPGLSDMHGHIGADFNSASQVSASHASASKGERADLLLYLLTGVTTVRNAVGSPQQLALARAIDAHELLGPRLATASILLEGEDNVWPFSRIITNAEEGRTAVREMVRDGYDYIKIYHTLSNETFYAVMDEAKNHGVRVIGHIPFTVGVEQAIAAGQSSIEHFRGYDIDGLAPHILAKDGGRSAERFGSWLNMSDARMDELVATTAEAGTWNCPTFVVNDMLAQAEHLDKYADHPMAIYMPPAMLSAFENSALKDIFSPESRAMLAEVQPQMLKFLKKLHDAGALMLTGTDTAPSVVPGFTLIDELRFFERAGLTRLQLLKTSSQNAAAFLGDGDTRGSIQAGMTADLVLLGANPLDDLNHLWRVEGVMADGRWATRGDLLTQLKTIVYSENNAVTN